MTDATGPRRSAPLAEFLAAVIFLTRLPIPWRGDWPADLDRRALAWFPIVGLLIGAIGGAVYWVADGIGLPSGPAAALTLAALLLLTGALHEDGLADLADGLGGGRDRARKLEIMKDSRIGTYGAAALVLALATKLSVLTALADPRAVALALMGAHGFSRGLLPGLKASFKDARSDGLAAAGGRPEAARSIAAAVIGLSFAATTLAQLDLPPGGPPLIVAAAAAASVAMAVVSARQLDGVTGDVLGACQQVGEIAFLLGVAAALR